MARNSFTGVKLQTGFTLIELMIVAAIAAIVAAIAFPLYNDYIGTSQEGALVSTVSTIEMFQEDFRLRNGGYLTSAPDLNAIDAGIGWLPQANDGATYSIAPGPGTSYEVTATKDGLTICVRYPEDVRC